MPSPPRATARLLSAFLRIVALASIAAFLACARVRAGEGPPAPPSQPTSSLEAGADSAAEHPYSVQMHLHALSNHNASEQPASIQWHTWFARDSGVDVLWWSEHAEIFAMADTFRLELGDAVVDPRTLFVSGLGGSHVGSESGRKRGVIGLAASSDGGGVSAEVLDSTLYVEARRNGGPARIFMRPVTASGPVRLLAFARPIAFGAIVEAEIDLGERDAQRIAEFRFPLSWHRYGKALRYEIRYRLVPEGETPISTLLDDATVLVTMPCKSGRSTQWFDLEAPARLLRDGDDGTLSDIEWGVEALGSEPARMGVRRVRLWTKRSAVAKNVAAERAIATRYEREYSVRQEFGGEFAWGSTHLNAFYPDSSFAPEDFRWTVRPLRRDEAIEWVAGVHRRGGLASFNHPFGTSFDDEPRSSLSSDQGEGEADDDPRSRALTNGGAEDDARAGGSAAVARRLLATRAFGCDILEVGYLRRGGATLDDHLALWDLLTTNRCFLYGNGTSDSHGGVWFGEHNPNWFVTWIWARDHSPEALLSGARAGRIYFGDRSRWDGAFDVWLGPYRAGDRVAFEAAERELPLRILLDPIPPGAQVRLVRGALAGADGENAESLQPVEYADRGTPVDLAAPGALRIDAPCFVRIEVSIDAGMGAREPLLFANPIVFY